MPTKAAQYANLDLVRHTASQRYSELFFNVFALLYTCFLLAPVLEVTYLVTTLCLLIARVAGCTKSDGSRSTLLDMLTAFNLFLDEVEDAARTNGKETNSGRLVRLGLRSVHLGVCCWVPVVLLWLLASHVSESATYSASFYSALITVFGVPPAMAFSFATEFVLRRPEAECAELMADRLEAEHPSDSPPHKMMVHHCSCTTSIGKVDSEPGDGATGKLAVAWGVGKDEKISSLRDQVKREVPAVVHVDLAQRPRVQASCPSLYVWGAGGTHCYAASAEEAVALPENEQIFVLVPYPPPASVTNGRCFILGNIDQQGSCLMYLSRWLKLLILTAFCLLFSFSHNLIPHIYKYASQHVWPCTYPRLCGLPCGTTPFSWTACTAPLGHGGITLPMFEGPVYTPSVAAVAGTWLLAQARNRGTELRQGDDRPCTVEIRDGQIQWFSLAPIPVVEFADLANSTADELLAGVQPPEVRRGSSARTTLAAVPCDALLCTVRCTQSAATA